MFAWGLLVLITVELAALVLVALRWATGVPRIVLVAQAIYWAIAYILRPAVLLAVEPMPRLNDSIADGRLLGYGHYAPGLVPVLWLVSSGLFLYVAVVCLLFGHFMRRPSPLGPVVPVTVFGSVLTYSIGQVSRALELSGAGLGPITSTLSLFAPLGAGLILIFADGTWGWPRYLSVFACLFLLEGLYGVLVDSKTPLMTLFLLAFAGAVRRGLKLSFGRGALAGLLGVGVFTVAQRLKASPATASDLATVDSTYPWFVQPLLPLVRRFDLFSAATDAYLAGPSSWAGPLIFAQRALRGLLPWATPEAWNPYGSAGRAWASEVRSRSLPEANRDVSLADGYIAEGFSALGPAGLIVEVMWLILLVLAVARFLTARNALARAMGVLLLAQPALFERGLLGGAEIVGQSLQAAVCFGLLSALLCIIPVPNLRRRTVTDATHPELGSRRQ